MFKRKELIDFECEEIISLYKRKYLYNEIKELLGHPKLTIGDIVKKYNEQGLTSTISWSGRSKILTDRDNRQLIKIVKNNRSKTLEEITESFNTGLNISVSSSTVWKTLYQESYSEHVVKKIFYFREK